MLLSNVHDVKHDKPEKNKPERLYSVIGEYVYEMYVCNTGVEWTDPSKSAFCTTAILFFGPVGLMVLPGIAYFIRNWRILQLVLFSPLLLILGMHYWSAASRAIMPRQVVFSKSVGERGNECNIGVFGTIFQSGFSQSRLAGS